MCKVHANEEYYEQTARETTKALEELRNYCSSPESKPWRTMTRPKDPQRFASFMEGQPHLMDGEIMEYESLSVINNSDISNDDDSEDELPAIQLRQPVNGRTFGRSMTPSLRTSTPTTNGNFKCRQNGIEISDDDDE